VLQYAAVCCSVSIQAEKNTSIHKVAEGCSALYVCNMLQCEHPCRKTRVLQKVAEGCSALQGVAVCCKELQ